MPFNKTKINLTYYALVFREESVQGRHGGRMIGEHAFILKTKDAEKIRKQMERKYKDREIKMLRIGKERDFYINEAKKFCIRLVDLGNIKNLKTN